MNMEITKKPRYKVHINIEQEYKEFLQSMADHEDLPLATYLRRLVKHTLKNYWSKYEENRIWNSPILER